MVETSDDGRTNLAHVCASRAGRPAYEKLLKECVYDFTFSPIPDDNLEKQVAFERELSGMEKASMLIVDLDVGSWGYCVGYCVARGKTIIGIYSQGPDYSRDFRVQQSAFIIRDLTMLERCLRSEHLKAPT